MFTLEFFDDPAAFLDVADAHLSGDPVRSTVLSTVAHRAAEQGVAAGVPYHWFAVARDGDEIVGTAMRTAPFEPYPMWVNPMPDGAAAALADALELREEVQGGANGALPSARIVADQLAATSGRVVQISMASRLHELADLIPPVGVAGTARLATLDDADLCLAWFNDFYRAADEQAGSDAHATQSHDMADIRAWIEHERVLLWEDDGEVVHLCGHSGPALGVARIGPVYTPKERRGHGYAAAGVAEVSRRLVADGARVCLFTDQSNSSRSWTWRITF